MTEPIIIAALAFFVLIRIYIILGVLWSMTLSLYADVNMQIR